MGKKLVFIFVLMFLFSFTSAKQETVSYDFPLIIETPLITYITLNDAHTFNFQVYNETNGVTLTNASLNCSFGLQKDDGTFQYSKPIVGYLNGKWTVYVAGNNFTEGHYHYGIKCVTIDGTLGGVSPNEVFVNRAGEELTSGKAIIYIGAFGLLVLLLIGNFVSMGFLPSNNTRDEEGMIISISYLKYLRNTLWMSGYFLFIALAFITANIMGGYFFNDMLYNFFFSVFTVAMALSPIVVIVWIVWIFASMFHDKKFQQMLNRGIMPGQV